MHPSRNDSVPADTSSRSSPPVLVPLLGRFLQTQRDSFNAVSAVRHQPHHQDARTAALSGSVKRTAACLPWSIDSFFAGRVKKQHLSIPQRWKTPPRWCNRAKRTVGGQSPPSCEITATERERAEESRRGWKVTAVLARCRR